MSKKKRIHQEVQQVHKEGLDHLDDETLAQIATDRDDADEMTYEAKIAFNELARRSGLGS